MNKESGIQTSGRQKSHLQGAMAAADREIARVRLWLAQHGTGSTDRKDLTTGPRKDPTGGPDGETGSNSVRGKPPIDQSRHAANFTEMTNELKALRSNLTAWHAESRQDSLDEARGSRRSRLIATLIVITAIVGGTAVLWVNTDRQAKKVRQLVDSNRMNINSPSEGAEVRLGQKVRGVSPFTDLSHYLLLTIVRTSGEYILASPVHINSDQTFNCDARLNDIPVADYDQLKIQVLATSEPISSGKLDRTSLPIDAVFSTPVTVTFVETPKTEVVITNPTDGAQVQMDSAIIGRTALLDWNHYVVITPARIGTSDVQQRLIPIGRDGTFAWTGRFSTQVGIGDTFTIRVLATKSTLSPRPLASPPADATFSNSVTVRRQS